MRSVVITVAIGVEPDSANETSQCRLNRQRGMSSRVTRLQDQACSLCMYVLVCTLVSDRMVLMSPSKQRVGLPPPKPALRRVIRQCSVYVRRLCAAFAGRAPLWPPVRRDCRLARSLGVSAADGRPLLGRQRRRQRPRVYTSQRRTTRRPRYRTAHTLSAAAPAIPSTCAEIPHSTHSEYSRTRHNQHMRRDTTQHTFGV